MSKLKRIGPVLIGSVATAAMLSLSLPAQAVKVTVGGHVNRMVMWADNDDKSDVLHVDNSASQTRVNLRGEGDMGYGLTAGFFFEEGYSSNPSSQIQIKDSDLSADSNERWREVYFKSKFGQLSLGQGSGVTDGIVEYSFANTFLAQYVCWSEDIGNLQFEQTEDVTYFNSARGDFVPGEGITVTGTNSNEQVVISNTMGCFDGNRLDRARYDTPKLFNILTASVSTANDNQYEVALRGDAQFGAGWKLAGGIGYKKAEQRDLANTVGGSIALDTPWGINLALSAAKRDYKGSAGESAEVVGFSFIDTRLGSPTFGDRVTRFDTEDRDDAKNYFGEIGYKFGPSKATAISFGYGRTEDQLMDGADADYWGIGIQHNIKSINSQLYAGFRNQKLDLPGRARSRFQVSDPDDIRTAFVGARVRF